MIGGTTNVKIEDGFDEYGKAVAAASKESIREVCKIVAKDARQNVRRAAVHRISRTYPGGRKYDDPKPLHRSVAYSVRGNADRGNVRAKVFFRPGYSNFPSTEAWQTLKDSRERNIDKAIPILRGKVPK